MVSSSRKKNRGKERKAKKVEIERAKRARVRDKWVSLVGNITCNHGYADLVPTDIDHPVVAFLNHLDMYINKGDYNIPEMMLASFNLHPRVWNDESYRGVAIDIMTSAGTNMLLLSRGDTGVLTGIQLMGHR